MFVDEDNQAYLYYSRDCSENKYNGYNESHIYGVLLSEDRRSIEGEPILLTKPEQPWELQSGTWHWNEGPYVLKHEDKYYLMYSANFYSDPTYSLGYAVSDSPLGLFTKYEKNPILYSEQGSKKISGPGHHNIVNSPGDKVMYVSYHTHSVPVLGGGNRQMNLDVMGFREDGSIFINGPTISPQLQPKYMDQVKKINASILNNKNNGVKLLFDGELVIHPIDQEQVHAINVTQSEPIHIEFDSEQTISTILLYSGLDENTTESSFDSVKVEFSNGYVTTLASFIKKEGNLAYISFEPMDIKWIKIMGDVLISEVMIF